MTRLAAVTLAATVVSACGPLSLGEAEVPELCQDLDPVQIPAAPADFPATVHFRTPLKIAPQLVGAAGSSDVDVKFVRATLTAESVSDLGFVDRIELSAMKSEAATPLGTYVRSSAAPAEITLAPTAPVDLTALMANGAVDLDASITAAFPNTAWTLLPRVCYAARAGLNWSTQ